MFEYLEFTKSTILAVFGWWEWGGMIPLLRCLVEKQE
jgi:hypothetical protein